MSRSLGLALLLGGLGGCTGTTIVLGNPYPDGGGADAGPVPTVEVLPNPLDFGGISSGETSPQLFITILNAGNGPAFVIFDPPAPAPPFSSPGKMVHLSAGQLLDKTIGVTFAPTAPRPALGHLNYWVCASSDPDGGGQGCSPTQSIRLQGNGL
jgi:hypothetical protein